MKRIFLCTVVLCLITLTCYAENLKYIGLKEGVHHYVRTDNMKIVNVFNKDNPTDFKTIGVYYEEVTIQDGLKERFGYIQAFIGGNSDALFKRMIFYTTDRYGEITHIFVDKPNWEYIDKYNVTEGKIRTHIQKFLKDKKSEFNR